MQATPTPGATEGVDDAARLTDLLEAYRDTEDLDEARAVLAALEPHAAALAEHHEVLIGDLFEELADWLQDEDDLDAALEVQERAVALGCENQLAARRTLAWWRFDGGQVDRGEALFAELLAEHPEDVLTRVDLGLAREDHDPEGALRAYDEALALAVDLDDELLLRRARVEREELRWVRGLPADEHDRAVTAFRRSRNGIRQGQIDLDLLSPNEPWFPPDELVAARTRWPDLSRATMDDPDVHRRAVERSLRQNADLALGGLCVVPITVARLLDADLDGRRSVDRQTLANRRAATHSIAWPPGRNDPCWCGSGTKYKRCCGRP